MEAFFLNDDDEYLELEFSPQGLYLFIMLDGYRNDVLTKLPLMPEVRKNPVARLILTKNILKHSLLLGHRVFQPLL